MKRRGLLTKLLLGSLAAPSVAKAVIPTEPPAHFFDALKFNAGMNEGISRTQAAVGRIDNWTPSGKYQKGQVITGSNGTVHVCIETSVSTHPELDGFGWRKL